MLSVRNHGRSSGKERRLAWSLAAVAGCVNAAGFYAVGLYSSHMTGALSVLADHIALGDMAGLLVSLAIVASFLAGTIASTLLMNEGERHRLSAVYAYSVMAEAVLLAALGCVDLWIAEIARGPLLVLGLSFLMGQQNAIVTRLSNARIRTTHVTGMVTDIGIELGNMLDSALHRRSAVRFAPNRDKLMLYGPTVLCFLGGGVAGVLLYRAVGSALLLGLAGLLAVMALPTIRAERGRLPDGTT
ncbi:YoaK family protein [Azospirillum sp. SYSU D00513]|uniref:YoaK family protein n=1 Tax=Azospirillum sp. SYSU D00513 TaxID=2812561 RepID=UPI001A95F5A0|nr:YoaK family protein [Azospirillum sp. SYSU D00513]